MKSHLLNPLSYAIALSLGILSLPAYANDGDATVEYNGQQLDTIEVEAVQGDWLQQANQKKVFNHAGARTIIGREQLDETASTTIRDALKQVPGVQVQENNGTGGTDLSLNVGVRGLPARFAYRSTILVDGVPLSFAPYGQPQLSFAPLSMGNVESVDVVRGAGSVRFGPQNVGGIMNFNTRSIPQEFKGSVSLNTEFAKGNVKYNPTLFVGNTFDNGLGLALLYSGTRGDGYRDQHNETEIDDIMLKSAYNFSDEHKVQLNAHYYNAKADMPNGLTVAEYEADPFQVTHLYDKFTGHRSDVSFRYNFKNEHNNAEILAYYIDTFRGSIIQSSRTSNGVAQGQARTSPRDYSVFAFEPRFSHRYDIGQNINSEVTVGYRYLQEKSQERDGRSSWYNVDTATYGEIRPYSSNDGRVKVHAAYIDNRFDIGAWSITPGVRFESVQSDNTMAYYANGVFSNSVSPSLKSNEWLPNLAVLYRANDHWNLFANAGVSFGPQQNSQLARINNNRAEETITNLHPEKSNNYEIGTKYLSDNLSAELTLFYLDFETELARSNDSTWTNLGATSHKGIEAGIRYDLGQLSDRLAGLSTYANYTYTDAKHEAGTFEGRDLSFYSRHVANLGLRYAMHNWVFNSEIHARSKQEAPYNGTVYTTEETADGKYGTVPGYATMAINASYDANQYVKGLKVGAGIKNLFDKQYFIRSADASGGKYVGQPRTVYLQASYDF